MSDEKNNFQNRSWSDRDGFGQSRFSFLNFTQSIIFILLCLGTFSIFADEQDRRYDSKNLYDPPSVKITEQDLNGLRQSLQDPSKDSISEIQKVLGQYYSQFIDSRRIEEEKRLGKIFDENTNRNTIRLLILNMFSKLTPSGMMRDSPILFELHMLLSKEYDKKKQNAKAIESALAAIRYRDFSHTEEEYLDERRLAEIFDPTEKQGALSHKQSIENLEKSKKDLKNSKDFYHLFEANLARGKETKITERRQNGESYEKTLTEIDLVSYREKIKQSEMDLKIKQKEYNDSKLNSYEVFRSKKSKEDAEVIYYLAGLVKQSENENKERLKVVNRLGIAGSGIFVLFDYKRNTDFYATAALWELATKLDPMMKEPVLDLAKELKSSGKKAKAIDFYKKYLELARGEKIEESKLAEIYFSIASLYTELKQNVLASSFYELYYKAETDFKKRIQFSYELGSFFENRTGDLERAAFYYGIWLKERTNPETSGLTFLEMCELYRQEFLAELGISKLYSYHKKPKEEKLSLNSAIRSYERLKDIYKVEENKNSDLKKEILFIKRNLLEKTDDSTMAQYRLKDLDFQESTSRLGMIRTKLNSTPVTLAMKRLSVLLEEEKDFLAARKIYESIVKIGNPIEINLSLKNIDRINKILEDGIKREPL
ncbi:hypothetical protein ACO2J1_05765 [Leptospira interrogans]|uniref:Tetratricopeptide repeat protein n=2 Tax=Leptospira interrogans TaxID=173 RepID=A0AAV9FVK8_LEPIR|nr:hypothetical protein [Leptospira interrogans]AJR14969.1 hypothetical protein LIL_12367 [Leptospira interrogans serovar Linhai str. 56609]EKO71980.1 hypothetical protein LEP1GSC069_2743 [Leptospira interrogans serovar Canicola str. Fiocruz LV133]EMJ37578.1 hypothetical protein LEP1GSC079_0500 [Leptospira interrogans str. FPW1039]EMK19178.1 hypothetical protein LEP1GSC075_3773 [Leptospira interrogans str. Kito]EMN52370.1 hypothetical protein LEP1GSC089_0762 [Leptospira interrogans serovar Aut